MTDSNYLGPRGVALLDAVMAIGGDLELPAVLRRIVEAAVTLVDCEYGALGVLAEGADPPSLVEFITTGVSTEQRQLIGHPPHGAGILGLLLSDPMPLRLPNLNDHPEAVGFPANHPPMKSFLGVPIRVRNLVFGNLYLTEKVNEQEFTEDDQNIVTTLATAAGVAIENARLFGEVRRRERSQSAAAEINRKLLAGDEAGEVLELIAAQARSIADAQIAVIAFSDPDGNQVIEVADGQASKALIGIPLPLPEPSITVPLTGPTQDAVMSVANLAGGQGFRPNVTRQLQAFASQAALALELAEARRDAEKVILFEERDRIARDLHDSVIQRLFAAGMKLESVSRSIDDTASAERIRVVVDDLDATIRDIRATIYSLQTLQRNEPLGLRARIVGLAEQLSPILGSSPAVTIDGPIDTLVPEQLSDDLIAVVRETLSNVARHAHAKRVELHLVANDDELVFEVRDDGVGFPTEPAEGESLRRSGLSNLDARARHQGGNFEISSTPGRPDSDGWTTHLRWQAPIVRS